MLQRQSDASKEGCNWSRVTHYCKLWLLQTQLESTGANQIAVSCNSYMPICPWTTWRSCFSRWNITNIMSISKASCHDVPYCAITIHNCHNFLEKMLEHVSGEESYGELRPTQMPLYVLRCQWVADQNGVRVEEKWRARAHGSAILADHPASRPPRVHQHIKICEASVQRCRGDGMSVVRRLRYIIYI